MLTTASADDFHLGRGWYDPWAAAYLAPDATTLAIDGLPLVDTRAPLGIRHRRSQTNVHSPRLDLHRDAALPDDLPAQLLAARAGARPPDMVTLEYVPDTARLFAAAQGWQGRYRVALLPQAAAPAADCRGPYAAWLAARSKRGRTRWPKIERKLLAMGMRFAVLHGREGSLPALLDDCFRVEQSGWKGKAGSAIGDSTADTRFYTDLAHRAAAAGALRIALLRHDGRIVAFEYGVIGGDRLFLLKVGYDERYEHLTIGHALATMHIRHCCEDPTIAWYDKLGNGMTPAPYKLRFADTVETLYRITLFSPTWRGRLLQAWHLARHRAKRLRDRWRARAAA